LDVKFPAMGNDDNKKILQLFQNIVNARKSGDVNGAFDAAEKVLEINPDHQQVLFLAIDFAITLKKLDKASLWLQRLSALPQARPEIASLHFNLASAQLDQGLIDDAVNGFLSACTTDNTMAEAFFYSGIAYEHQGQKDKARRAFKKALHIQPDYVEAWRKYAGYKLFVLGDEDQAAMEKLLKSGNIKDQDALHLHFALYKACQDQQDYDQAFHHLRTANDLKRQLQNYDVQQDVDYMMRIAHMFDPQFLDKISAGSKIASQATPVFIIGLPRSGSTLIEQILSRHPNIDGAGEIGLLENLIIDCGLNHSKTRFFPDYMVDIDPAAVHDIALKYIKSLSENGWDGDLVVNKTPANFLYIGLILLIFPNAKIIHSVRHPVATGFSCYQRLFQDTGPQFVYHQQDIVDYMTAYQNMMVHWHDLFPGRILDVHYEDVVDNLPAQAKQLIKFCEVDWHADCIDFHKSTRHVMTASNTQVRQPLYKNAVDFWRHYEKHLGSLHVLEKLNQK